MSARDELAATIVEAYGESPDQCPCEQDLEVADHILAAGYRKPRTIQYVVVTADGGVYDCSFGLDRQKAQKVADQATADAASVGLNYVYRVAELIEPEATA